MTAIVLLSHGSPDLRSASAARDLAIASSRRTGLDVEVAFLQHNRPGLTDVCRQLGQADRTRIVVVPMLLSAAFHSRVDVPAALGAAEALEGPRLLLAAPLDADPSLFGALSRRVPDGPVVVAAAGTSDPGARERLHALGHEWAQLRGTPVAVAHVSADDPRLADVAAEFEQRVGGRSSIASFLLYPGILHDRVVASAAGRPVSPPLYDSPEVVRLTLARARAVLEGDSAAASLRSAQRTSNIA